MILDPGSQVRRACVFYSTGWEWGEWEPQGSKGMVGRRQVYGLKRSIFYFVVTVIENHFEHWAYDTGHIHFSKITFGCFMGMKCRE